MREKGKWESKREGDGNAERRKNNGLRPVIVIDTLVMLYSLTFW